MSCLPGCLLGLFRRGRHVRLRGDGEYDVEVVGESHYQDALSAICGGKTAKGHNLKTTATLILENDNPHDDNAIRVEISGRKVGYLSRSDAKSLRKIMAHKKWGNAKVSCPALIKGGWDRGRGDEGDFGVSLDVVKGNDVA